MARVREILQPWRQQPPAGTRLRRNPAVLLLPQIGFDAFNPVTQVAPNSACVPAPHGVAAVVPDAGGGSFYYPSPYSLSSYNSRIALAGSFSRAGLGAVAGGVWTALRVGVDSSGRIFAASHSYPSGYLTATGPVVGADDVLHYAATWEPGGGVRLAFGGQIYRAPSTDVEYNDIASQVRAGDAGVTIYGLAAYTGGLDDDALLALAEPWGMFEPLRIVVPVSAVGSTVPTITAVSAENITAVSADYRVTLDYA